MPLFPTDAYLGPQAHTYPNTRAGKRAFRTAYVDYNETRSGMNESGKMNTPQNLEQTC